MFDAAILAALVLGGLPWLYGILAGWLPQGTQWSALLMVLLMLVFAIPGLPLEWWMQFRIEEKFGFNKSTQKLWISDKIKGAVLTVVLAWPLLVALIWVFDNFNQWWIWGWGLFFGMS